MSAKRLLMVAIAIANLATASSAQSPQILIRLINGKNGKPIANQHIWVYGGASSEEVRFHKMAVETDTNSDGVAQIPLWGPPVTRIQVWPVVVFVRPMTFWEKLRT
jgi:hypothetical protein